MLSYGKYSGRSLPNEATGWQGIRRWFFGGRKYAHPALRWTVTPLYRLAWVPYVINVFGYEFHSLWLSVLFVALFTLALLAFAINALMLRRERRTECGDSR